MSKIYRFHVIGKVPPDLKEKIAALHATGILRAKNGESPKDVKPLKTPKTDDVRSLK